MEKRFFLTVVEIFFSTEQKIYKTYAVRDISTAWQTQAVPHLMRVGPELVCPSYNFQNLLQENPPRFLLPVSMNIILNFYFMWDIAELRNHVKFLTI